MSFTKKKKVINDKVIKYLTMVKAWIKNLLNIKKYSVTASHSFELNNVSVIWLQNSREKCHF